MMRKLFALMLLLFLLRAGALAETRSFTYGGSGQDFLYDAAVSADGRIVLTGQTDSSDGTLASRTKSGRSGWALCIDENGQVLWNFCTHLGSYDTLRYPVWRADGSVSMLLETSHDGLYEVVWIRLDADGNELARRTLDSRGVPWLVRPGGIYDAYQSGYVVSVFNKKTSSQQSFLYTFDGELVWEIDYAEEPYFPDAVLADGTHISAANSDGEYPDATVTFTAPVSQDDLPEAGFYPFTDDPPESLRQALAASPWHDASILDGCCDRVNGMWRYAQMILSDADGLWLCCGVYDESAGWQLEASRNALRQDAPPELVPIAQRDSFTPDTIRAAGGCAFFEICYPDVTLLWGYQEKDGGFSLCEVTLQSGDHYLVLGNALFWDFTYLYHDAGDLLQNFSIDRLPLTFEEASSRAAAMPQSNRSQVRLSSYDSSLPQIPMYAAPDESSPVIAHYLSGVNGATVQEGEDFICVRIGSMEGYIPRYNVLIGGERAQQEYDTSGAPGLVYGTGAQSLLDMPEDGSAAIASLAPAAPLEILGRPAGSAYLQVRTPDGQVGFMPDTQVLIGWEDLGGHFTLRVVSEGGALLYSQPDEASTPIGQCMAGAQVGRLVEHEYVQGWQRVIIQGYDGYMRAEDLEYAEAFMVMP